MICIKCGKQTNSLTKNQPLCREHREEVYSYRDELKIKVLQDSKYPDGFDKVITNSTVLKLWKGMVEETQSIDKDGKVTKESKVYKNEELLYKYLDKRLEAHKSRQEAMNQLFKEKFKKQLEGVS